MTNALLLSAGRGRRLAPLTDHRPKCLLPIASRRVLEWQIRALVEAGVHDITVVTGFRAADVEVLLRTIGIDAELRAVFNPFYARADNIGSCWEARYWIGSDTLLINGDTLFEPAVVTRVLTEARAPISVTIDRKERYDSDDMKVRVAGERLVAIGKTLAEPIDGESIGMIRFREGGGPRFVAALERLLRDEANLRRWYLSVIDELARAGGVEVVSIAGLAWAEIDFPHDLPIAEAVVGRLAGRRLVSRRSAV